MKRKVSELERWELDLMVATIDPQCEGLAWALCPERQLIIGSGSAGSEPPAECAYLQTKGGFREKSRAQREGLVEYAPSARWVQGGGLFDDYIAEVRRINLDGRTRYRCRAMVDRDPATRATATEEGSTLLIAGMRAIVAAKYGAECELPNLTQSER